MKPKVLLGVTGGIAAYKAAEVASQLVKSGVDLRVIMTPAATRFIAPLTFAALSHRNVLTSIFPDTSSSEAELIYPHLYPASEADAFAVVPASADIIAKLAHGFADDLVCCSALALKPRCKRIFCPAMNVQMWEKSVVQENAEKLLKMGWHQVGPEMGSLACGTSGLGRMTSPSAITQVILNSVF